MVWLAVTSRGGRALVLPPLRVAPGAADKLVLDMDIGDVPAPDDPGVGLEAMPDDPGAGDKPAPDDPGVGDKPAPLVPLAPRGMTPAPGLAGPNKPRSPAVVVVLLSGLVALGPVSVLVGLGATSPEPTVTLASVTACRLIKAARESFCRCTRCFFERGPVRPPRTAADCASCAVVATAKRNLQRGWTWKAACHNTGGQSIPHQPNQPHAMVHGTLGLRAMLIRPVGREGE
jgi:hypothetical protein